MQSISKDIKDFYNNNAKYFSHTRKYIWPELLPLLKNLKSGDSILDVGCGNGRLLSAFKHSAYKDINYTGIDFSKGLITIAKTSHPKSKFLNLDITKAESWTKLGHYDAIFCIAVLHHLPTKQLHQFVVNNIKNHLKPDGFAVMSVWNLWQLKFIKYHLTKDSLKLKRYNWKWLYVPFQKTLRFCNAFTPNYLKELLTKVGFTTIETISSRKNILFVVK